MSSAIAALIGLVLAIVLIIKKLSPVYSLMIGALAGGLLSGWGLGETINLMLSGVNDITPAVLRILAAGVLSGVLIKTGAATSISCISCSCIFDNAPYRSGCLYRCGSHNSSPDRAYAVQ